MIAVCTLHESTAAAGDRIWVGTEVRLTEAGSALFGDAHGVGQLMERLIIVAADAGAAERRPSG